MFACGEKKNTSSKFCFFHQKFQLDRVHLQEVKRSSYEHTKKCADQLLLLGQVSIASWYYLQEWKDFFLIFTDRIRDVFLHTCLILLYWEMCYVWAELSKMNNKCCLRPLRGLSLQRLVWPLPLCHHSRSNYRLKSATCLLEVLSLPPSSLWKEQR